MPPDTKHDSCTLAARSTNVLIVTYLGENGITVRLHGVSTGT